MNQNQDTSSPFSEQFISILQVRPSQKEGPTIAYVDFRYYRVVVRGASVIRNKGGGYFVAFPSRQGNDKWFPIVEFDEPDRSQIIALILKACEHLLSGKS